LIPPMNDTTILDVAQAHPRAAVLIPCYNEEISIGSVVRSFRTAIPDAVIYVYDNNSTDRTAEIARAAGAIVRWEGRQGKGNVVRRMFADVDADIYILVDGDDTYDASAAPGLVQTLIVDRLDFVNGARVSSRPDAYRPGHRLGNRVLSKLVEIVFGRQFADMLSGYKVLSRRFVKSFPAMSRGFETETELAVHALELRMPCAEIPVTYRDEKPMLFFGLLGLALLALGLVFGTPIIITYFKSGLVPRLPTAVLSASLIILGMLSVFAGLILDVATKTRREIKRLIYLNTA
jgi:glycosyltransferase involved in cell wall biosynthesis